MGEESRQAYLDRKAAIRAKIEEHEAAIAALEDDLLEVEFSLGAEDNAFFREAHRADQSPLMLRLADLMARQNFALKSFRNHALIDVLEGRDTEIGAILRIRLPNDFAVERNEQ